MVMFNNLSNMMNGQAQPRKTDQLLSPTDVPNGPTQGGAGQPATAPATTAIDASGNQQQSQAAAAPVAAGKEKQSAGSASALVNANKDVEVKNDNLSKAVTNSQTIANNQVTSAESYKPQATDYAGKANEFIDKGGVWTQPTAADVVAAPDVDKTQVTQIADQVQKSPDMGMNRLDAILGRNSAAYGNAAAGAVASTQGDLKRVGDAADAANLRRQDTIDLNTKNLAGLGDTVKARETAELDPLNKELARRNSVESQQQTAAQADARQQAVGIGGVAQSWLEKANPGNGNWSKFPGMNAAFNAFILDKAQAGAFDGTFSATQGGKSTLANVVTPEKASQLNRIRQILGLPEEYQANGQPIAKASSMVNGYAVEQKMPALWQEFYNSPRADMVFQAYKEANPGKVKAPGSGAAVLNSPNAALNRQ